MSGSQAQRKEFDDHCKLINDCCVVYDEWEMIAHNLTDERLHRIGGRRLTVHFLARALSLRAVLAADESIDTANPERRFELEMFLPKEEHTAGTPVPKCFCRPCREYHYGFVNGLYGMEKNDRQKKIEDLHRLMMEVLPRKILGGRNPKFDRDEMFSVTKEFIFNGKLYGDLCMAAGGYTQFRSMAKNDPFYKDVANGDEGSRKAFADHCQFITDCCYVYDNWETIVSNLTDERMDNLDARTFRVDTFRSAINLEWCLMHNEKCRDILDRSKYNGEYLHAFL